MADVTIILCGCVFTLLLPNLHFAELRSSDQFLPINGSFRTKRQSKDQITCVLPNHPSNGELTILASEESYLPNSNVILNTIIDLSCKKGYGTATGGLARSICYNGVWTPQIAKLGGCVRRCPAVRAETENFFASCLHASRNISCDKAIEGTSVQVTCKLKNIKSSTTCRNGYWENEIFSCGAGYECRNTEFGCCSDAKTPALGPNYEGCPCTISEFGCCLDGFTPAKGNNFENCLEVPEDPQAYCSLAKVRGDCKNQSVLWFYDFDYGGCSRFWYSGCGGNGNKFRSKKECEKTCVEPPGKDACKLLKVEGPCEGNYPKWFYSKENNQCSQFIYRGCLGNTNKFETAEECNALCVKANNLDTCEQPKEEGPCRGNYTRWFYNKESSTCEQFTFGGCNSNQNNFSTETACRQKCMPSSTH